MIEELYGTSFQKVDFDNNKAIFNVNNKSGYGDICIYNIFEGINVVYNDFKLEYCDNNLNTYPNIIEINHCKMGRYECEFEKNKCDYISEGDLAINSLNNRKVESSFFPLGYYQGITILIDLDRIEEYELFSKFGVDIRKFYYNISHKKVCIILRANQRLEHIFYELYNAEENFKVAYLRIKVIELLLFISQLDLTNIQNKRTYLTKHQVEVTKSIKNFILEDITKHYTIEEIAKSFNISSTIMKNCFKEVYGTGIYNYLKVYRLQKAINYLQDGKLNITQVANKVGYSNPAKFSTAFKSEYGITPTEFIKNV